MTNLSIHDESMATIDRAIEGIDRLVGERIRIAKVLEDFWLAPLSISTLQPILDLARELNPHLK